MKEWVLAAAAVVLGFGCAKGTGGDLFGGNDTQSEGGSGGTGGSAPGSGGTSATHTSSTTSSTTSSSTVSSTGSGNYCGNGSCDSGETCSTCASDCGSCCGDSICGAGESCATCPSDCSCSECGDGSCDGGETCTTCSLDCGSCGSCTHDKCTVGGALLETCDACVAEICFEDPFCCDTQWDATCVGEVASVCGEDCGGGSCGNGICGGGETCASCPSDCSCGGCTHDICTEGALLDPGCDPCVTTICAVDPFCCDTEWDSLCVEEVGTECGQSCF